MFVNKHNNNGRISERDDGAFEFNDDYMDEEDNNFYESSAYGPIILDIKKPRSQIQIAKS
jgi:hypothetical protein